MANITKTTQIKKLENATQLIQLAEEGTRRNLYTIASALAIVDRNKLYEEGDYKNTAEYGEAMFNYKRATTSALIRVAVRFLNGANSTLKQEGEKDYTIYQLMELLPLSDADIANALENGELNPYMTTKAIRDLAKGYRLINAAESETEENLKVVNELESKQEPPTEAKVEDKSETNKVSDENMAEENAPADTKANAESLKNMLATLERWLKTINVPGVSGALEGINEMYIILDRF